MFFLFFALLFLVAATPFWVKVKKIGFTRSNGYWTIPAVWATWITGIAAVFLLAGFIATGVVWSNQITRQASISQYQQNQQIYTKKATYLTAEFKTLLAQEYPQYEKSIFKEIVPQNASFVFIKFPQIQASKGFLELVDQIRSLQDQVYDQATNITRVKKNQYASKHNPWLYDFLLPG